MAAKNEFTIDGRSFHIGDSVAANTPGAEMGRIIEVDMINQSVKVEYASLFNGKVSMREKTFPVESIVNRTAMNRETGKALLKEINSELKSGSPIDTKAAWETTHKNGTYTERVGNQIALVEAHMRELKKEGLVTETAKGFYEPNNKAMTADEYATKIDDPKIDAKIDNLAIKSAKEDLEHGFVAKVDQWIMDKTDVKAMGSGWSDFKNVYDSIVDGSREYSNSFYQNNSKEFAALDQIVTEIFAATVAASAVTGKWMAKNMGRAAYSMAKGVGRSVFGTTNTRAPQKQGIIKQGYEAAKTAWVNKVQSREAFARVQDERMAAREKAQSSINYFDRGPLLSKVISDSIMRGESVWDTERGQAMIKEAKTKAANEKRTETLAKKAEARELGDKKGFDRFEGVKREPGRMKENKITGKLERASAELKKDPANEQKIRNFLDAKAVVQRGVNIEKYKAELNHQKNTGRLDEKTADKMLSTAKKHVEELAKAGILKETNKGEYKFTDEKSREILTKNQGADFKEIASLNKAEYMKIAPHLAEENKPKPTAAEQKAEKAKERAEAIEKLPPKQKEQVKTADGKTGFDRYSEIKRSGEPLSNEELQAKAKEYSAARSEAAKTDKNSPEFRAAQRNFMDAQASLRNGVSMKSVNEFNSKQIQSGKINAKDAKLFADKTLDNARNLQKAGILKEDKPGEFSFVDQKAKEILTKNMGADYKELSAINMAEYKKAAPHIELAQEGKQTQSQETTKTSEKRVSTNQYTKEIQSVKESYAKELKELSQKYESKIADLEKQRPDCKENKKENEQQKTHEKTEEKTESLSR
jgi:hypothetical protein